MSPLHDRGTLTIGDLSLTVAPPTERTTLQITVERDATLLLRAPERATTEQVERFVESKRSWIYRKLAEKDALVGPTITKQFVDGEGFAYLGRSHRLRLEDAAESIRLDRGRFVMSAHTAAHGRDAMRHWYRSVGMRWLQPRAAPWARRLGIEEIAVDVLDLGYRWGSARQSGIHIHWAALQLPPGLIDYVLAHELTHLHHPNHSGKFWTRLDTVMPDYEIRKEAPFARRTSRLARCNGVVVEREVHTSDRR